ncbi:hypothetical protein GWK36_03285 [Caldichromatium japonicum]|uniref:Uncharacterized protein n=1 Tax=Caldichromatium japonicum TaxID=2699430 RepID=A0A6G7VB85_9GAMM|nr:hypothetical protein [Caldichromatium japonicum]QIK37170.1 hypothetical protein GWK36_03285 [Caldichromatium japonicum]
MTTDDVGEDQDLRYLGRFKDAFSQYADKVLHGTVAAMVITEKVAHYAERRGLYLLL